MAVEGMRERGLIEFYKWLKFFLWEKSCFEVFSRKETKMGPKCCSSSFVKNWCSDLFGFKQINIKLFYIKLGSIKLFLEVFRDLGFIYTVVLWRAFCDFVLLKFSKNPIITLPFLLNVTPGNIISSWKIKK